MAKVTIQDQNRTLTDPAEINAFLAPFGIQYERWELASRLRPGASSEEILTTFAPEIERLKQAGNFVTADVVSVNPNTPNLDVMLQKFNKEHTHSEDEVRFCVDGKGVFHIHPEIAPGQDGPVFGVELEAGDLINVPCGVRHWFDLCEERTIVAIRLFQDTSGWTPHYIEGSRLHENYQPMCWSKEYFPAERNLSTAAVKL
jgi:1,2-dihydroxy-3-keto-5-methylthiopentene dioxygenase